MDFAALLRKNVKNRVKYDNEVFDFRYYRFVCHEATLIFVKFLLV